MAQYQSSGQGGIGNTFTTVATAYYSSQRASQDARRLGRGISDMLGRIEFAITRPAAIAEQRAVEARRVQEYYAPAFATPGRETLDVPVTVQPYDALIGLSGKQIGRTPALLKLAKAQFGGPKKAVKALRYTERSTPQTVSVQAYGVNSPMLRGSRGDPAGLIVPVFKQRFQSDFKGRN